jgi:holo-[acyl-carrier protein] synthase
MIVGVGIDLTPVDRMEKALTRHGDRFEKRVFTDDERAYCRARARPADHFAARFAAKEAVLKAMAVPEGLSWHELEIVSRDGRPDLKLTGVAARAAEARGIVRWHLSLTHAGGQAAAVAVAEA